MLCRFYLKYSGKIVISNVYFVVIIVFIVRLHKYVLVAVSIPTSNVNTSIDQINVHSILVYLMSQ